MAHVALEGCGPVVQVALGAGRDPRHRISRHYADLVLQTGCAGLQRRRLQRPRRWRWRRLKWGLGRRHGGGHGGSLRKEMGRPSHNRFQFQSVVSISKNVGVLGLGPSRPCSRRWGAIAPPGGWTQTELAQRINERPAACQACRSGPNSSAPLRTRRRGARAWSRAEPGNLSWAKLLFWAPSWRFFFTRPRRRARQSTCAAAPGATGGPRCAARGA